MARRLGRTAPLEQLNEILDIGEVGFYASSGAVEELLRGTKEQNATGVGRFEAGYQHGLRQPLESYISGKESCASRSHCHPAVLRHPSVKL